jgi:hypothetical protein
MEPSAGAVRVSPVSETRRPAQGPRIEIEAAPVKCVAELLDVIPARGALRRCLHGRGFGQFETAARAVSMEMLVGLDTGWRNPQDCHDRKNDKSEQDFKNSVALQESDRARAKLRIIGAD